MIPYHLTDMSRIKKLEKILASLDKSEPIAVLYDDDADGVTAGVFLRVTLEKLAFTQIITCPKSEDRQTFTSGFLRNLESMGVKTIICVDFEPLSWKFSSAEKLQVLPFNLIIIDHHFDQTKIYDDLQTENELLFIHPQNCSDSDNAGQYCTAKFSYDICSQIVDLSDHAWKQAVGMIGDMNVIKWPKFIVELLAQNGIKVNSDNKKEFFTNPIGRISQIIGYASSQNSDEVERFFAEYVKAENPEELLHFEKDYAAIASEFMATVENWEKFATYDSEHKIYFVKFNLKHMLTSVLSSIISYINEDSTFMFYQHNGGSSYHISMRSQKTKVHLGDLLRSVSANFVNSRGGGHAPAAGAICNEKDIDAFIQKVKDSYKKF